MKKLFLYLSIIILFSGCSDSYNGQLIFVEPDNEDKFEHPYFLFIPDNVELNEEVYIVIEPNNSGFADDDIQKHIEQAKKTASNDYYTGNYISQNLKAPLIIPVFPRGGTEWRIYTHALDRDVMLQKGTPLERIDIQLIEMFKDAQSRLREREILTKDKFLLTGFSASGTFANRFTLLHPDWVLAVAAGGLNGLLMLPLDSLKNEVLKYPIGTSNLEEISDRAFQKDLFCNTPQLYFMGQLDTNDAIPYADAFDQDEREQIYRLLGEQMQPQRWNNCIQLYKSSNVNATIFTYSDIGHGVPGKIKEDIVKFFRESINKNPSR